jgi:hypothetical protein
VTAEIAGLDARMPETREKKEDTNPCDGESISTEKVASGGDG